MEVNGENKKKFKFSKKTNEEKKQVSLTNESSGFTIEELKEYYTKFMENYNKINESIKNFQLEVQDIEDNQQIDDYNKISTEIKNLKEDYINNSQFLIAYDKHHYLELLETISEELSKLKDIICPKKKFAFTCTKNNQVTQQVTPTSASNAEPSTQVKHFENECDDFLLKNKVDSKLTITKEDVEKKNNLIIEDISACDIYLLSNFKACYLKNISGSNIYIGSISGGTHVTNCNDCNFFLATHQLRIHDTFGSNFHVIANSNPIIENSSRLAFLPLKIKYDAYEENLSAAKIDMNKNKWNLVQDFKWHKKEKSPNFELKEDNNTIEIN